LNGIHSKDCEQSYDHERKNDEFHIVLPKMIFKRRKMTMAMIVSILLSLREGVDVHDYAVSVSGAI
jgi:hypothetical protein